jgi:hypothetical protein
LYYMGKQTKKIANIYLPGPLDKVEWRVEAHETWSTECKEPAVLGGPGHGGRGASLRPRCPGVWAPAKLSLVRRNSRRRAAVPSRYRDRHGDGSVTLKKIGFFCFPIKHSTHTAGWPLKIKKLDRWKTKKLPCARSLNLPYCCMRLFFAVNPYAILYAFLD